VIWLCLIARSSLAILRQSIAKQAMLFGNHLSLKKAKVIWVKFYCLIYAGDFGEEQSLSVRELSLLSLKKAMPFGNHLSLKRESDFSNVLSLNLCWRFGKEQLLSICKLILLLNKRCLLAITHHLKAKAISVLF
jgi:hypothetical protein